MAPVARTLVVKKATFQDNVKAALMGGKQSAQAVLKHVAAARITPVTPEKTSFEVNSAVGSLATERNARGCLLELYM